MSSAPGVPGTGVVSWGPYYYSGGPNGEITHNTINTPGGMGSCRRPCCSGKNTGTAGGVRITSSGNRPLVKE